MKGTNDTISGQSRVVTSGHSVMCAEAQADGVPCTSLGKSCEECEKAVATAKAENESEARD